MNQSPSFKNLSFSKVIEILLGFCMFLLCMPYFIWDTGKLSMYIFIVMTVISLFYIKKFSQRDILFFLLFLVFVVTSAINNNFFGILIKLFLLSFLLVREDKLVNVFYWFKKIFVIFLVPSLIVYILIVFFNIQLEYHLIKPLNSLKTDKYLQFPFLVSDTYLGFKYLNIRFFGMFDEPGVIGSFAIVFLFADRFNLRSKQNIILMIAGILSFSFYFIVSGIFFMLLFSNNKFRFFAVAVIAVTFLFTRDNVIMSNLVWDRFIIENGEIRGDNRGGREIKISYNELLTSEDLLLGKGEKAYSTPGLIGTSSYKELIIKYGLLSFLLMLLAFSLYANSNLRNRRYLAGYLFLFGGLIYQRPFIFDPPYFFLMIVSIYALKRHIEIAQGEAASAGNRTHVLPAGNP